MAPRTVACPSDGYTSLPSNSIALSQSTNTRSKRRASLRLVSGGAIIERVGRHGLLQHNLKTCEIESLRELILRRTAGCITCSICGDSYGVSGKSINNVPTCKQTTLISSHHMHTTPSYLESHRRNVTNTAHTAWRTAAAAVART